MTTAEIRERPDEAKLARTNFVLQAVLALPFLILFGFTTTNVAVAISFLVLAAVRWAYPYNETLRKIELWLAIAICVIWVLFQVI
jgi:hypothetical protein